MTSLAGTLPGFRSRWSPERASGEPPVLLRLLRLDLEGPALRAWQAFWAISLILISLVRIDPWIHAWVAGWPAPVLSFFRDITDLGRSHWVLVPTGIGLILFRLLAGRARGFRARQAFRWTSVVSGFVFIAVATTGLATVALKYLIGRARPKLIADHGVFSFQPFGLDADFAGFPSGHANTAVALAICLIFLWPRFWPWFVALAAVIASSRIIVGAHYPSDVVAGACLAILTTYAWRHAFAKRRLVFSRRADGTYVLRGRRLRSWMVGQMRVPLRHRPQVRLGRAATSRTRGQP